MNKQAPAPAFAGVMGPCALFVLALTVSAASADPTWKKELSSPAPGPFPSIAPSSLELQLSWKGMLNSGKVNIDFAPKDAKKAGAFVIRSTAASLGPASGLFPYQNHFWSELNPTTWKPIYFHAVETDRKETVTTTTRHFADRVESTEITKIFKDGKTKRTDRIFQFAPTFDIFSAMLHIRSQKLDIGNQITLVVHPFDNPYLLRVKVIGRELHMNRKAIRLSVGMRKIDRKTLELVAYNKMTSDASLWLSDDADRIPLEFRAAVFIGDVRATMTRFTKP
jgi:Protein of unknown function (DUF3108)